MVAIDANGSDAPGDRHPGEHRIFPADAFVRNNAEGREATPCVACIDTQSVKTKEIGGDARGYDGGKKIKGRKRHLLVDILGLLIAVVVTGANADDGTGAPRLLERVDENDVPRLKVIFGEKNLGTKA